MFFVHQNFCMGGSSKFTEAGLQEERQTRCLFIYLSALMAEIIFPLFGGVVHISMS